MRRSTAIGLASTTAAAALVVGIGIVWPGLDAQETPPVDTSVWALQTADGRRYARVNTAVRELDTVRAVSNPNDVVQSGGRAYIFSDSYSKVTPIDPVLPADLGEDVLRSSPTTPVGTVEVTTAGDFVAYMTDSGAVYVGRLSTGEQRELEPYPSDDEDAPQYTSDAIAVDERGRLYSYSSADGAVLRYDIPASEVRGRDELDVEGLADPVISAAGNRWVVVDVDGDVRVRDVEDAWEAPLTGTPVISTADESGDAVYVADDSVLVRVPIDGSEPTVVPGTGGAGLGTPARPVARDGVVYAAWLPQGDGPGTLWNSETGAFEQLDYGGQSLEGERRPVFVRGAGGMILNETRTGWVWTIPDGRLVESSQDWSLDDEIQPDAVESEVEVPVVIEPRPPVAEPDAFGVRAGALTTLPVLLNDHDPNGDVLSIDPASVAGLDPAFGTVSITDDGQRITVRTEPGATGTAAFSYAVTDGTVEGGLPSDSAVVTLTVTSGDSAPVWCGVDGCLAEWPEPEVARGGTVTVPVLPGWVDPEGDPMLLLDVRNLSGRGSVAATPDGDVVYQHSDDGSEGAETIELDVTVSDTTGRTASKTLVVEVTPEPELRVQSFAVIDSLDAAITVDVAPHVTGTAGTLWLDSVRVLDDAAATATVLRGSTEFDFAAREPGTYRVGFTVTDGTNDDTGTARITVLPSDAPPQLATAPVVAFVHPQQDATLDVFVAVENPTRRVLLLSDVVATADPGASLSVDVVGQNYLRVSGTTATSEAGRLGTITYTVSDGTADRGASVQGEATVYLLPLAPELAPIAVDDSLVVRAGAQIDIPVLENDIAPAGGRPILNPASVTSSTDDALAFAAGDTLRYLAPEEPGEYRVEYSVYSSGAPSLTDSAVVRIDVLPNEENRAPQPHTVEGRVLSGQSTVIEFDGYGMDPDGDVVRLDQVVSQPDHGVATISPDGESLVYASVAGFSGQVSFRYRVVDAFGKTGEATARVGVLDSQANPSPITFTDYVQVQVGASSTIRVSPLSNDIDPTMGELTITDVRPDVAPTLDDGTENPEYERLEARLREVDEKTVVISAGNAPGTMAFLYDVVSTSGNTGRGLIVVKAVRERVPDFPIVTDTVLTAESREDFPRGVDVLTGKVSWSSGDVDDLELALWGDPRDVTAQGRRIRGSLPETTRVIPFAVTGEGRAGEVTTYGFLRVPGEDDLALALRAGMGARTVRELASVAFDMSDLVVRPRGAAVEVGDGVKASGAREDAACVREAGAVVRYDAGAGAPWVDACQVPVRLAGQTEWTYLSVPIRVEPLDPQPELRAGSMTVGPGETATFDLKAMTAWQLRPDWDGIEYALDYRGAAFDVSLDGSTVTVTGADRAVPGTEEASIVSVTSHAGVEPVRLILRVGAAPSTLPRGGSVTQQCTQAVGTSCTIDVIGATGEVNPLPRTPLQVVDVKPTGACVGVTFEVASATSVMASWTSDAPGATCTAAFSVQDAQNRRTNAERDGQLLLDLLGYPKAPASVRQTAYANGSLTLRVDPGESARAYPALSGFVVRYAGEVVAQCDAQGICPSISAPNGERRVYEAAAVNAVGESLTRVSTAAWAYDAPPPPAEVSARPVVTGGEGGVVAITVDGVDASQTASLEVLSPSGELLRVPVGRGQTTVEIPSYRVGSNSTSPITVTPFSRFELPPGLGGTTSGSAVTVWANGIGAPRDPVLTLTSQSSGDGTSVVRANGSATPNGDGSTLRFGIVRDSQPCTATPDGASAVFRGLPDGEEYAFTLCVESYFGGTSYGRATTTASVRAVQSGASPTGWTFVVDGVPNVGASRADWIIRATPTSAERIPNRNRVEFNQAIPPAVFDRDPGLQVRYVHESWGTATPWTTVAPAAGSAPFQLQATWWVDPCVGGSELQPHGDSSATPAGKAAITFSNAALRYFDAAGAPLASTPGDWTVPVGAVRVEGIGVSVDWSAQGWGLQPVTTTFGAECNPNLPPTTPTPEP